MCYEKIKVNGKMVYVLAKQAYGGSGGTAPHIRNFGIRWRWGVNLTFRPLCPMKEFLRLRGWLYGSQRRPKFYGQEKNSSCCGQSNHSCSVVTAPSSLSRMCLLWNNAGEKAGKQDRRTVETHYIIVSGAAVRVARIRAVCAVKYIWYHIIYLSTAIGLTPSGSSTVHIYTQTIYRTTQITTEQHKQQYLP